MALLLYRLGKFSARHRWPVIAAWLVILIVTGGSAALFHGQLSNDFKFPGTETQTTLDKLKTALPDASGGSAPVVFQTEKGDFTQAQKDAIGKQLDELSKKSYVVSVVNPFTQQAQLDDGAAKLSEGKTKLDQSKTQLDAAQTRLQQSKGQLDQLGQAASAPNAPEQLKAQYAQAKTQYDNGQAQYQKGLAQYQAGEKQLQQSQKQLDVTSGLKFVVTNSNQNYQVAQAQIQFKGQIYSLTPADRQAVQTILSQVSNEGVKTFYSKDITQDISQIFGVAEIIGVVVAAIVLVVMLGTLIAAGLPLVMALIGVGVGVGGTFALTGVIDMSSISPMLALMLGLAVGIDYSLFIVNRHRQQILKGMGFQESIGRAIGTSGNAVFFAGLTVVIALAALSITGLPFLTVLGLSAAATVSVAVLIALTLTPAVLSLIGKRIVTQRAWRKAQQHDTAEEDKHEKKIHNPKGAGWGGLVTRHPWLTVLATVVVLGVVAIPAASLRLALPDGGSEPTDSSAFKSYELVKENFGAGYNGPLVVVGDLPNGLSKDDAQAKEFDVAQKLRQVKGVAVAIPAALSADNKTAVFQVITNDGPADEGTVKTVNDLRAAKADIESQTGVKINLTGQTAANIDVSTKLGQAMTPYLVVVIGLSLILLLLAFRSIVVPLLATAGFLLSLAASFGGVVAVYQWGWLGQVFDVANPAAVLSFLPIILVGVLFGLAMDYQVFITSGMREAFAKGEAPTQAVRTGFSHAAKVVVAAAIIMTSVFSGFIFSHLTMIRPLGFALAFGVLIDAFIIRMTLVPAVMKLFGKAAWWLPKWLDRVLPDVDVEGAKVEALGAQTQDDDDQAKAASQQSDEHHGKHSKH